MAAKGDFHFLYGDDLDPLLVAADILEGDPDFSADVDSLVDQIPDETARTTFTCSLCPKICISRGGLTRHMNAKHSEEKDPNNQSEVSPKSKKKAEDVLHPLYFKKYIEQCTEKLSKDECYPEGIMKEFQSYNVGSLSDVLHTYNIVKDVIEKFDGDSEKFYPLFYKRVSDAEQLFLRPLSHNCSLLLGFEVANHVLCHLSGSMLKGDVVELKEKSQEFNEKEKSVISYLSGYVFSTFYRRIRFSKKPHSDVYSQQYLGLLLAGKLNEEGSDLDEHKLINVRDRGGLWKTRKEVIMIFTTAESLFRSFVSKCHNKINAVEMVSALMKDSSVIANFSKLCDQYPQNVKGELRKNMLHDILSLYIRVRTFSFVKDKVQLSKIQSNAKKSKSLRTELKQSTACLEQGH